MNFKTFLCSLIVISSTSTAQVIETEQFCRSNNGKDQVIKSKSCDLKVLCNHSRVDVFHVCKDKKTFFSFNADLLASNEVVTSVNFVEPNTLLTTHCNTCKTYKTRLIKGIPSSSSSTWEVLQKFKSGFLKFTASGELMLHSKCKDKNQTLDKAGCLNKEVIKF